MPKYSLWGYLNEEMMSWRWGPKVHTSVRFGEPPVPLLVFNIVCKNICTVFISELAILTGCSG